MVFFSCNACGESLKKNQVEKHYTTQCRRCEALSCIDCNKVFWGDEYREHTKCITEEEKYSGKNYVPKAGANKGEAKQNQWFQQVQEAIEKNKSNLRLRNVLEKLKEYPNVPRKQKKFENFARSSLNIRDSSLTSQVWEVIMSNAHQQIESNNGDNSSETSKDNKAEPNGAHKNGTTENEEVNLGKKLSKREKKEERRKNSDKKEKKDKKLVANSVDEENGKKKKKKRKRDEIYEEEDNEEETVASKKRAIELSEEAQENNAENEDEEETEMRRSNVKFDWISVITAVLKKKGELSVKKLRKKVLAEYTSVKGEPSSPEKLYSKFNKKIQKNPAFVVLKDKVKLKEK